MSPVDVVQTQLDSYNRQDLDGFCACFAAEAVVADLNGETMLQGIAALRDRYRRLFAEHPGNRARLVNRIAVGDVVVDHEEVRRDPDGPSFLAAAIYTVREGRIVRLDLVR